MNESITYTIIVGAISGVISSAVVFMFVQLFKRTIIPWYLNEIYRGIKIKGNWIALPNHDITGILTQEVRLQLIQQADILKGNIILIDDEINNPNVEHIRVLIVEGRIFDRFVQLHMRQRENNRIGAIVMLLEVVGDGRQMNGIMTFYGMTSKSINKQSVKFIRE